MQNVMTTVQHVHQKAVVHVGSQLRQRGIVGCITSQCAVIADMPFRLIIEWHCSIRGREKHAPMTNSLYARQMVLSPFDAIGSITLRTTISWSCGRKRRTSPSRPWIHWHLLTSQRKVVYVSITTNQSDTKFIPNPNHNATTKQHAVVSIQLNIVRCAACPEKFIRDNVIASFLLPSVVIISQSSNTQKQSEWALSWPNKYTNYGFRSAISIYDTEKLIGSDRHSLTPNQQL